jgi:RNA polymerase primary sigma factor
MPVYQSGSIGFRKNPSMVSGAASQGAADLELLRAVFAHRPDAWALFVRRHQSEVYTACCAAFPENEAKDVFVQMMAQLRADDFALLRAFDGRAAISSYLRLVLRDLLSERVSRLLSENPERGWRAFEHFFKRDLSRIIARYFHGASDAEDDIYHDIVSALIEDDYRRILAYDGQGSFGGFVLRIVNNLCIDRLRKDVPRRRLPAAIQRLPAAEQEVFRQLYWEDCPEHQLAAALRARKVEVGADAVAAAVAAVRAALPRNFTADEDSRPRLVALPGSAECRSGEAELPDERLTPEDAVIASEDEETLEQATGALKAAIARLPQEIRLYLQYVMSGNGDLPPRDIAKLMARPVTDIYRLRQQAERLLRQTLSENSAVKNLRMSV